MFSSFLLRPTGDWTFAYRQGMALDVVVLCRGRRLPIMVAVVSFLKRPPPTRRRLSSLTSLPRLSPSCVLAERLLHARTSIEMEAPYKSLSQLPGLETLVSTELSFFQRSPSPSSPVFRPPLTRRPYLLLPSENLRRGKEPNIPVSLDAFTSVDSEAMWEKRLVLPFLLISFPLCPFSKPRSSLKSETDSPPLSLSVGSSSFVLKPSQVCQKNE